MAVKNYDGKWTSELSKEEYIAGLSDELSKLTPEERECVDILLREKSDKGKTFKIEVDNEALLGKKIGDKIDGKEVNPQLDGFELEITGTSDKAGFPGKKDVEGQALTRVLLTKGFGMKQRPKKEGKGKPRRLPKGFRLKKSVRGAVISRDTMQINTKVLKQGVKKLEEYGFTYSVIKAVTAATQRAKDLET